MSNRENFWTGLILGGLVGMSLTLMLNRTAAGIIDPSQQKTGQGEEKDKQTPLEKLITLEKQTRPEKEKDAAGKKDGGGNGAMTGRKGEPAENSKKTEKEGEKSPDEVTGKVNFGKRIARLEEALKGLRDEEG